MHDVLERGSVPAANVGDAGVLRRAWRNAFPFIVVGALWETVAHLGIFPAQFFPPLETIAAAFARLTGSGVLPHHALDTLVRLTVGFALAAVVGIAAGVLMGRSRRAEDILLPLVSIGAPIPRSRLCAVISAVVRAGQYSRYRAGRFRLRFSSHLQFLDRRESGQGDLAALGAGHGR